MHRYAFLQGHYSQFPQFWYVCSYICRPIGQAEGCAEGRGSLYRNHWKGDNTYAWHPEGPLRLVSACFAGQADREELRREALAAYAEELERKNMDEDAGLAYVAAGLPERAIEAYMVAGQWRMALALAGKRG